MAKLYNQLNLLHQSLGRNANEVDCDFRFITNVLDYRLLRKQALLGSSRKSAVTVSNSAEGIEQ